MDDITISFNNAVDKLCNLAKEVCINSLPGKIAFIKGYSFCPSITCANNRLQYEIYCLDNNIFFSAEQIINDVAKLIHEGRFISWIDLTLYYVNEIETIILVDLIFSNNPVSTEYHIAIKRTWDNSRDNLFNLNDYVDEIRAQYKF